MGIDQANLVTGLRHNRRMDNISDAIRNSITLNAIAGRTNAAFMKQLSLAVGLHFIGSLVDVYLLCFHCIKLRTNNLTSFGGVRTINHLWRLSAVSSVAHYAVKQVCVCVCKYMWGFLLPIKLTFYTEISCLIMIHMFWVIL